jgi:hypothetical protein
MGDLYADQKAARPGDLETGCVSYAQDQSLGSSRLIWETASSTPAIHHKVCLRRVELLG